jgi:NAD(P)H-hydrate epimerase
MLVASARQMRSIDRRTMDQLGVSGLFLMENAGRGVASVFRKRFPGLGGKRIAIICGKGNNGGDGFVVARYLIDSGAWIDVALLGSCADLRGDAQVNMERWKALGRSVLEVSHADSDRVLSDFFAGKDFLIDGIFGTGLERNVEGLPALAIELMNGSGAPILAIDVPSGVSSDTGAVLGCAVRARVTATLALPKLGLLLYPGAGYAGEIECIDIGIPDGAIAEENLTDSLFDLSSARDVFPVRKPDAHKGDCGKVWVLGGSVGLTGAVTMAAESAIRVGAGLVTAAVPASLNDILEVKLTEAMTFPLPETTERNLHSDAGSSFLSAAAEAQVLAVGPGVSRNESALEAVRIVLSKADKPVVLDADGIRAFSGAQDILRRRLAPTVITPHPGEMAVLTGLTIDDVESRRVDLSREIAKDLSITVVLKGAPTVTATQNGYVYINTSGNAGLATGGTGDVLTGTIAGFVGQGMTVEHAAALGVFVHGLAGDLAAEKLTQWSMRAGDVIRELPQAIRRITVY